MYVLIKFTLLVYLSYIYSVNQSSYSVASSKKKYLGLLQILKQYIHFLPISPNSYSKVFISKTWLLLNLMTSPAALNQGQLQNEGVSY